MSKLPANSCAKKDDKNLVVVFSNDGKKASCFDRKDLIDKIEHGECNYSSAVLIREFKQFSLFQKYYINEVCHYRPIKGSIESYIDGLLSYDLIESKGNSVNENIIGKGAFGKVIQYGDSPVVEKSLNSNNMPSLIEYNIIKLLSKNSPCCILGAYDIKTSDSSNGEIHINTPDSSNGEIHIYMEKMQSDLINYIKNLVDNGKRVPNTKKLFFSICKGIYYAHSLGILHGDLKLENILIDYNDEAHITDWGISQYMPYTDRPIWLIGTTSYRAPENHFRKIYKGYSFPSDIFSLGLIGIELYTQKPHSSIVENKKRNGISLSELKLFFDYQNIHENELRWLQNFLKNIYNVSSQDQVLKFSEEEFKPQFIDKRDYSEDEYNLFNSMLSNLPEKRPTISQVLNHPYFDDIRKEEKFPEIKKEYLITNLPIVSISGNCPLKLKLDALLYFRNRSFSKVTDMIAEEPKTKVNLMFHSMNLFNRYASIVNLKDKKIKNNMFYEAFWALAQLIHLPHRHYFIDYAINNMRTISKALNYELITPIPILYLEELDDRAIRMLLAFEYSNYKDINPYLVAKYIGDTLKLPYINNEKIKGDEEYFKKIEELMQSACFEKTIQDENDETMKQINEMAIGNRFVGYRYNEDIKMKKKKKKI